MTSAAIGHFARAFPEAETILELGSLEGGRTFGLARLPGVRRIVAIEGKPGNLERARFMESIYRTRKIEWVHANLETADLSQWGTFDAVFCQGILYHMFTRAIASGGSTSSTRRIRSEGSRRSRGGSRSDRC